MKAANLSDAERELIRHYYSTTPNDLFDLAAIAALVGRPRNTVSVVARQMGLTRLGRPHRPETSKRQGITQSERIKREGHPRGMLGKRHTAEARAVMSVGNLAAWERAKATGTGHMSEDNRQRRSDLTTARHLSGELNTGYSRTKSGKREDLGGLFVRSSWEANIARYLNWLKEHGDIYDWAYEADTFQFHKIKRGTRFYTPDFKIWDTADSEPYYWEVKGWMDDASKTRLSRMARYYPHIKLIVIGQTEYYAIAKEMKYLIPEWEIGKKKAQ